MRAVDFLVRGHSSFRKNIVRSLLFIAIMVLLLTACASGTDQPYTFSDLPPQGDAVHGEALFNQGLEGIPACMTCHRLDEQSLVGPGLGGYAQRASTRVEGESAAEYTFNSITRPGKYVVQSYSNLMYKDYATKFTRQDAADLIAYLLTL
jgi:cytochrome c2